MRLAFQIFCAVAILTCASTAPEPPKVDTASLAALDKMGAYAKINGVDTDQYAFREGNIDWQVWIQRGDKPLPQKIVITDTSDNAMPEYGAVLHWTTMVKFNDAAFAFRPPKDAKQITIASR